jgi:hypothetical protein
VWATDCVGGSSGRPDPFVGDSRESGRWGPKGTHVSHTHTHIYIYNNKKQEISKPVTLINSIKRIDL